MGRKLGHDPVGKSGQAIVSSDPIGSATKLGQLLGTLPSEDRPFIELVVFLAFSAVILGRDPWLCFGFAILVILINIAWIEWKRGARTRINTLAAPVRRPPIFNQMRETSATPYPVADQEIGRIENT